uniref:AAR2 splicing factor homolog n=1 Tax=Phaeomonas parva TaxID=124430 RepID=A0A7S1XRE8_9STRA|eukprot:CAMPEP_0118869142 /NCGR_PEP_ID=MMETSP1163-20130328/12594_1 /TAXON_ID=124430 /ORGANISM="Phaeomonas parva, Strain CCMP2877" /LENGTH=629 /DNA_ID=CAMNT_0006804017 /DNA_START=53 /DNA_END=1945 /DNA_ORIENTATION=-
MTMDQARARAELDTGGFLVLLGVPEGLDVGLDCRHQKILARFRGFKMVPPGLHLLHYGWGGRGGDTGLRRGVFFEASAGGIVVLVWDPAKEEFVAPAARRELLPEGSEEALAASVRERRLDGHLAPYEAAEGSAERRRWANLTNSVSPETLRRAGVAPLTTLFPDDKGDDGVDWEAARVAAEIAAEGTASKRDLPQVEVGDAFMFETPIQKVIHARRRKRAEMENPGTAAKAPAPAGLRSWTDIDALWMGENLERVASFTAEMLSQAFIDVSPQLVDAVESGLGGGSAKAGWRRLIGEWQLSFIFAIWLLDGPALRQWQRLSHVLLTSERLVNLRPNIAKLISRVTVAQLHFVPDELFHEPDPDRSVDASRDDGPGESFYCNALGAFLESLLANPEPLENPIPLQEAGLKLHRALESRTGRKWDMPSLGVRMDGEHREEAAKLFEKMQQFEVEAEAAAGQQAPVEKSDGVLSGIRNLQLESLDDQDMPLDGDVEDAAGAADDDDDDEADEDLELELEMAKGKQTSEAHGRLEARRAARKRQVELKERYQAAAERMELDGADDEEDEDGPTLVLPQELAQLVGSDALVELLGPSVAWRGPDVDAPVAPALPAMAGSDAAPPSKPNFTVLI